MIGSDDDDTHIKALEDRIRTLESREGWLNQWLRQAREENATLTFDMIEGRGHVERLTSYLEANAFASPPVQEARRWARKHFDTPYAGGPKNIKIMDLYGAIAHGDTEHRTWLWEALQAYAEGRPVPTPRSKAKDL